MSKEHVMYENYCATLERNKEYAAKENKRIQGLLDEATGLRNKVEYYTTLKETNRRKFDNFREEVQNDLLGTALKAIYMTALTETMILTDTTKIIGESLVDDYIKEHSADAILRNMSGKTYLLDRIKTIVEEAEEEVMDKSDADDPETQEVPEETKEEMFNKMEKEDDVDSAVEIIAQRISSAEEEFIKKNAEDKQKIEDIIDNINNRLQAAKEDPSNSDEDVKEIEQEMNFEINKKINSIREDRPHSVFEVMVREVSDTIMRTKTGKEDYLEESGDLNMNAVIDSSKCIYGFLEFLNTVGLEKVDAKYIKETLNNL